MIKPAQATPAQHMFLSAYDIGLFRSYNLSLLFYKLEPPYAFEVAVECLKESLSKSLVLFFPWAGRLIAQPDGRLALNCNDAGVEFVEATVDLPFSSLHLDNFEHKDFFIEFGVPAKICESSDPEHPLLSIQVTRFQGDEGMVMGVSSNHTVADAKGVWHFMKSWGELARGLEVSLEPIHTREELGPHKLITPPSNGVLQGLSCTHGGKLCVPWLERKPLVLSDFHFSSQTLKKLKHIASIERPCSTFEAFVAHLWKHVGLAKAVKNSDDFGLDLIADFRGRLNPPLPEAYFGNVVLRKFTRANMGELQRETLVETVKRIQGLIASLDEHYFKTVGGLIEFGPASTFLDDYDFELSTLQISHSPKFPIYDINFGWGKPLRVRSPIIPGDGEVHMWMGQEQDGSIDVTLALNVPSMERLKADKTFLSI